MFDSSLPPPEAVAGLDEVGLLATMELATAPETIAVDVQIAVVREMCRRQSRATAGTRPTPPPRRALTSSSRSSRRRRRKARKRRQRH